MRNFRLPFFFLLLIATGLAACRQSAETDSSIAISLEVASDTLAVGQSELVITVQADDGAPINDATVGVRGDMTHAGMQPVFATAVPAGDGNYRAPFEWTMGGDWVVTVTATLPDGRTTSQEFPFTLDE